LQRLAARLHLQRADPGDEVDQIALMDDDGGLRLGFDVVRLDEPTGKTARRARRPIRPAAATAAFWVF
jgi:hypothetical protein